MRRRIVGAVAAVAASSLTVAAARADVVGLTGMPNTYFPIGVFYQPANAFGTTSFTGWKARGINTLVGYENQGIDAQGNPSITVDQWSAAATNAGLYMIRQPREGADIALDAVDPNVIAYLQPDEPDGRGIPAQVLVDNRQAWQAAGGGKPVLVNFDGSRVLGMQGTLKKADYQAMAAGADWVAQDVYPVTGWNSPNDLKMVGRATSTLRNWVAPTVPTFAYIETSNQRLFSGSNPEVGARGPTPGEMRFEIWDAIIHGAKGIMYFPQSFLGFRFDATPVDVVAEMTRQNTIITSLAPVLNVTDPSTDQLELVLSDGKVEAMSKTYNGVTYVIALNTTNDVLDASMMLDFLPADSHILGLDTNTLNVLNGYELGDSFAPYGMHIYAVVPDGTQALAIPEPTAAGIAALAVVACAGRRRRRRRTCPIENRAAAGSTRSA